MDDNYVICDANKKPKCQVPGCNKNAAKKCDGKWRRVCRRHHKHAYNLPRACVIPGCANVAMRCKHHGMCERHYEDVQPPARYCIEEGCTEEVCGPYARFCLRHREEHEKARRRKQEERKRLRKYLKRTCKREGCTNPPIKLKGVRLCQQHYNEREERWKEWGKKRNKRRVKRFAEWRREQPCWLCGWHESICDQHRIIAGKDGGGYKKSNVVIICPNHHRIVTMNPLAIVSEIERAVKEDMPINRHLDVIKPSLVRAKEVYGSNDLSPTE